MIKIAVAFFAILFSVTSHAADFSSCSTAINNFNKGNVIESREWLRQYVIESYQRDEIDDRCQKSFVKNLTKSFVKLMNDDFLEICELNLTEVNVSLIAHLNKIESQINTLGHKLSSKARSCQIKIQKQYDGLFWLQAHKPEIADILSNCHQAEEILKKPLSDIRLAQAVAFIRIAELSIILEKESRLPPTMIQPLLDIYRIQFNEAQECTLKIKAELEAIQSAK